MAGARRFLACAGHPPAEVKRVDFWAPFILGLGIGLSVATILVAVGMILLWGFHSEVMGRNIIRNCETDLKALVKRCFRGVFISIHTQGDDGLDGDTGRDPADWWKLNMEDEKASDQASEEPEDGSDGSDDYKAKG